MEKFYRPVLAALLILIAAALVITMASATAGEPGIYISEICPHNVDLIHDSVGFFNDYIIISNSSSEPVCLGDYRLSDDGNQLDKFIFPYITLKPGDDLFLWAAPQTEFVLFGEPYTDDEALYTGFAIRDHEMLYLSNASGTVIDSVRLPSMKENRSLCRHSSKDRGHISDPSILPDGSPIISESIAPPILSKSSGFYPDAFDLSIDGRGLSVYYTTDGSDPYSSGVLYEGLINIRDRSDMPNTYSNTTGFSAVFSDYIPKDTISKATVLRAVCRNDKNGRYSRESVAVFFVGNNIRKDCSHCYTLSLVTDPENLFSYENGMYVTGSTWDKNKEKALASDGDPYYAPTNYNMRGNGWKREAHLSLFDPNGNLLFEENDIVGIHGQSSRSDLQKGFNLFPKTSGQRVFNGLFENSGDTLMLRTGSSSDMYDTNFRDALNGRISKGLNVFPQSSVCCQLYLDGEYWGCYNLQERLDASFVENRSRVPADNINIIKIDPDAKALSERDYDLSQYSKFSELVNECDLEDDGNYDRFCGSVDINSLIDYYCAEIFFANDDAYYCNMAMWRSRVSGYSTYQDGRWRYLLFDLDNTDGYLPNAEASVDSFTSGSYMGINPDTDPVFSNLVKNSRFRKAFRDRFEYLLANDFSYEKIGPIIDEMENTYTVPMVSSVRRFHDPDFDNEDYHENVERIRAFFKARGDYIYDYMTEYMGD